MLNILVDLLVLVIVLFGVSALFAVVWSYLISDKYWAWRERLAERKEKKRLNKKGL